MANTPSRMRSSASAKGIFTLLALLGAGLALQAETITAEQYGKIINLSGRQRMLSQKVSKELLQGALGIDKTASLAAAMETANLFDNTFKGLRDGSAGMSLPATTDVAALEQLAKVSALWEPFMETVGKVASSGDVTKEQIDLIARDNVPLLKEMDKAVGIYQALAAASSLNTNKDLAAKINLAGRQRMLSQKMSKEFYLIALGYDAEKNKESLKGSIALFDKTMNGLTKGDAELGLEPTTDAAALAKLADAQAQWATFRPLVEAGLEASGAISQDNIQSVAAGNMPVLNAMNKVTQAFEALSK